MKDKQMGVSMIEKTKLFLVLSSVLALTACGSGGGTSISGGTVPPATTPPLGMTVLSEQVTDFETDGTINESFAYTYDSVGRRSTVSEDFNGNGVVDEVTTLTYDAAGNLSTESIDDPLTPGVDQVNTYSYDPVTAALITIDEDWDNDGTGDFRTAFTYDPAAGDMLTWEEGNLTLPPTPGDPLVFTVDYVASFDYDLISGFLTTKTEDFGNNGTPDWLEHYTNDASGNRTAEEHDYGADTTIDVTYAYTLDPTTFKRLMEEIDVGADGTVDHVITYTYDVDGKLIMIESDWNNDQIVDDTVINTWIYI
jgi:hypothetical protein